MIKKIFLYTILLLALPWVSKAEIPNWSVSSSQFEFSMSTTAVVWLDEAEVSNEDDMLAAFVGDECRGMTSPRYNENYDRYFLYMTIFSNAFSGEKITFQHYKADADEVVDLASEVEFAEGEHLGSAAQPFIFSNTAQYCEVVFNVKNTNNDMLDNAIVTFNNSSANPGNYHFLYVLPGTYQWTVQNEGYLPASGDLTIEEGMEQVAVDVVLSTDNVGVEETSEMMVQVYPNPAQNNIGFKFDCSITIHKISIFDICGKQIWKSDNSFSQQGKIDIEMLHTGVYFINFETSDNRKFLKKFVKE